MTRSYPYPSSSSSTSSYPSSSSSLVKSSYWKVTWVTLDNGYCLGDCKIKSIDEETCKAWRRYDSRVSFRSKQVSASLLRRCSCRKEYIWGLGTHWMTWTLLAGHTWTRRRRCWRRGAWRVWHLTWTVLTERSHTRRPPSPPHSPMPLPPSYPAETCFLEDEPLPSNAVCCTSSTGKEIWSNTNLGWFLASFGSDSEPIHTNSMLDFEFKCNIKQWMKHRKNCECCPRHSLFKGHNLIANIVVLNCQKCNQCLKYQVSGHNSLGLLFEGVL